MSKPSLNLTRTKATSVSGTPLLYDSGVKYDDATAYYDRWYSASGDLTQGEIPSLSVHAEKTNLDGSSENIGLDSFQENIMIDSKQEDIKIKEVEEL